MPGSRSVCEQAGGVLATVYANGPAKRIPSGWATSTSRVWDGAKKITNTMSVYESDFGTIETVLNRYVASNIIFIIDDNLYKKANLVPVKAVPLAKRGLGCRTPCLILGSLHRNVQTITG